MPDDAVWGWFVESMDYGGYGEGSRPKSAGKPKLHREWFATSREANARVRQLKAFGPYVIACARPSPGPTGPQRPQLPGMDLPPMAKRMT